MNTCWYRQDGDDLLLFLKIQPRSSKDQFAEILGSERKLRIKAPPVDGKANTYLIKYLAKSLHLAKSRVILESGHNSRSKRIRLLDITQLPEALK